MVNRDPRTRGTALAAAIGGLPTDTTNALRALVFNAFDDLEAGKDRGTVQCELIAALATAQPDTPREPAEDAIDRAIADALSPTGGTGMFRVSYVDPASTHAQPDAAAVGKQEAVTAQVVDVACEAVRERWPLSNAHVEVRAVLAAHPKQGGGAEGSHKAGDHTSEASE